MKKKKPPRPKIRRIWTIHPKSRVKPSAKIYRRIKIKRQKPESEI